MAVDLLEKGMLFIRQGDPTPFQYAPRDIFDFAGSCFRFVVVACKVEQSVRRQERKLGRQWPSGAPGLPARRFDRNHDIAQQIRVILAEGEHVGRLVERSVAVVEGLHEALAGKQNAHLGAGTQIKRKGRFP